MAKRCANCSAVFMNDDVKFCAKCGSPNFVPVQASPEAETPAQPEIVEEAVAAPTTKLFTEETPAVPAEPAVQEAPAAPAEPAPVQETAPTDEWASMSAEIQNERPAFDAAPAVEGAPAYGAAPVFNGAPAYGAAPAFDTAEPVKTKKKIITPKRLVLSGIAVALAAVLVFTNVGYIIVATLTKWIGSDKAYMHTVEKHAVSSYAATIADYYEDYLADNIDNARIESSVSVSLGKQAKSLAKMYDIDLGSLDEAGFNVVFNSKGDRMLYTLALTMGGDEIVGAEMIFDGKEGAAFVSLKELTDKVLKVEIPEESGIDTAKYKDAIEKILPKPSTVEKIVKKYAKIAIDEIKDVDVSSETVEIDELSQKLTVVEYRISQETLCNMALEMIKAAKKDSTVKKVIKNVEEGFEDMDADLPVDLYDEFIDVLEELEDEIDADSASDETIFTVYSYVNGSHEVVGRKVAQGEDGDKKYGYLTIHDGKKYETEIDLGAVYCYGSGTEKSGKRTGEYTVYSGSQEIAIFEFENVDTKAIKKGEIKGTYRLKPGKELRSMLAKGISDSSIKRIVKTLDFALEINADVTKKEGKVSIGLLIDDAEFVTLNIKTKRTSGEKIKLPDDDDTVDATDTDEIEEFLEDLDFDSVLRKLRKSGLPEEIVDAIEEIVEDPSRYIFGFGKKAYSAYDYNKYYDDEDAVYFDEEADGDWDW